MKVPPILVLLSAAALAQPVTPYEPKVQQVAPPTQVELPPPLGISTDVPAALTLQDALQQAFRHQQNLRVARSQVLAAQGRTEQVAAARNPRLGIGSTYTDPLFTQFSTSGLGGGGTTTNTTGGGQQAGFTNFLAGGGWTHNVTLNQLLFDFGHTSNQIRASEQTERSLQAAYAQGQANVVRDVKQAYYNLLLAERLVNVQTENLANQRQHVAEAQARFASGLGLPSDVTRAETAVSTALLELTNAQQQVANGRLQLNLTMGIDPRTPVRVIDQSEPPIPGVDNPNALFDRALSTRPELIQYQANLASARATLDAAHTTSAPSIGASLSYQNRAAPSFSSLNLGLSINYQLFDGGLQGGAVREAQANVDRAQAELELAQQRVKSEVGQAYLELRTAEQRVAAATAEEANARETLRLASGRYRVGLGIFLDVVDAQNAFLRAQTNRVNALTQLDLSRATLARAIGEAPPADLPAPVTPPPVETVPTPDTHPEKGRLERTPDSDRPEPIKATAPASPEQEQGEINP
jgi:outer membrane protein